MDFYPSFGKFESETRRIETRIGGKVFNLTFGTLPPLLETALVMAGARGILGSDILGKGPVLFQPRQRKVTLGSGRAR